MTFRALASSSAGCCYHLSSGNHAPLLIDAGIKYSDIQQGCDFKLSGLAGALISHAHGDHSSAVPNLINSAVDVYSSAECATSLKIRGHYRSRILTPRLQQHIGPWITLPFEAVHDSPGTLGFVIDDQAGHRLLYLTDTAYSLFRFEGLTHIAIEANYSAEMLRQNATSKVVDKERFRRTTQNHMSLSRLLELLNSNDLSRVEEIHLLHLSDANSDEAAFGEAVRRATGKPVFIAPKFAHGGTQ